MMNGELNTAKAVAVLNKYVLQQQCGNRMELMCAEKTGGFNLVN
ncbi:hypothetical protein [Acinetobacter baumannii]|nr:hypothetical protein [Acinetobacter baumannii]MDX6036955.1 hypothetical protein [Acinetobacter baumannii]